MAAHTHDKNHMKILFASFLLFGSLAAHATGQTFSYSLTSREAFLHTVSDNPAPPLILDLAQLGIAPGQWLRLGTHGAYTIFNGSTDDNHHLIGVFSSSSTLQGTAALHRVVDAIAAGGAYVSGNTWHGNQPTDVPEDFFCSRTGRGENIDIEVPAGATHLFLGIHDSLYSDNSDPNGDFGADLTVLTQPQLPGTGEHVALRSTASGGAPDELDVQPAIPGSSMVAQLRDPLGFRGGDLFVFVAEAKATGTASPQLLPRLWMGNLLVVHFGLIGTQSTWSENFSLVTPTGFSGTTLVIQSGVLSPAARNGIFQTTHAHQFELQ